jgi:hypothetical protein
MFLCHKTLKTLPRLNQHLQSPVHQDKIYRCPKSDCRIEFVEHPDRGLIGLITQTTVLFVYDCL